MRYSRFAPAAVGIAFPKKGPGQTAALSVPRSGRTRTVILVFDKTVPP